MDVMYGMVSPTNTAPYFSFFVAERGFKNFKKAKRCCFVNALQIFDRQWNVASVEGRNSDDADSKSRWCVSLSARLIRVLSVRVQQELKSHRPMYLRTYLATVHCGVAVCMFLYALCNIHLQAMILPEVQEQATAMNDSANRPELDAGKDSHPWEVFFTRPCLTRSIPNGHLSTSLQQISLALVTLK